MPGERSCGKAQNSNVQPFSNLPTVYAGLRLGVWVRGTNAVMYVERFSLRMMDEGGIETSTANARGVTG